MSGKERFELVRGEPGFPKLVEGCRSIERIYGIGDRKALDRPCISIVGARRATPYGLSAAKMAGEVAAGLGITVVSGGARGCDYAAGRAALDAGGTTIVCAGCGADTTYPKSSRDLFDEARSGRGAVIALEGWGAPPRRYCFPRRNELIAALSVSTLVVEAGMPSGTFSTATTAAELGRNVYAVPGSIFSPASRGANHLIESGAAIIADEVSLQVRISMDYGSLLLVPEEADDEDADEVIAMVMASPLTTDQIARALGRDPVAMLPVLANYEASGRLVRLADGRYSPSEAELLRGFDRSHGRA